MNQLIKYVVLFMLIGFLGIAAAKVFDLDDDKGTQMTHPEMLDLNKPTEAGHPQQFDLNKPTEAGHPQQFDLNKPTELEHPRMVKDLYPAEKSE